MLMCEIVDHKGAKQSVRAGENWLVELEQIGPYVINVMEILDTDIVRIRVGSSDLIVYSHAVVWRRRMSPRAGYNGTLVKIPLSVLRDAQRLAVPDHSIFSHADDLNATEKEHLWIIVDTDWLQVKLEGVK